MKNSIKFRKHFSKFNLVVPVLDTEGGGCSVRENGGEIRVLPGISNDCECGSDGLATAVGFALSLVELRRG